MTTQTMQAAIFRQDGQVTLDNVETPRRAPGGVLVRVRACGICGSDLIRLNSP